jgi:hypothetical protein
MHGFSPFIWCDPCYLISPIINFCACRDGKSFYVDMGRDINKEQDNSSVDGESSVHYFLATTMIVWSVGKFYSLRRRWRFPTDQMKAVRLECEPRSTFKRSRRSKRGTDKVQDVVAS